MQQRSIPWLWIAIAALLLLGPGRASRLLIDVLGGLTLTLLLLPLVLGAVGWVGWTILQRRLRTCQACGFSSIGGEQCPACGTAYPSDGRGGQARPGGVDRPGAGREGGGGIEIDAREVIIDVQATDVSQGQAPSSGDSRHS